MKRARLLLPLLLGACEGASYVPPAGFVTHAQITYTDGLHNENTDMITLSDRILLIFRGGETGQIGSDLAHINVYASTDGGVSFHKQSEVSAAGLPGMRDIRDPKLVEMNGHLYLYAISRLPGGHYRDTGGEAWTIRAESMDSGMTWSAPVKTFTDLDASGSETFWGFWRYAKRTDSAGNVTLYALGYDDGDTTVGMFQSSDGISWTKQSIVIDSYSDVPSEAELQFFGDQQQTAVAIVRLDDEGILENGQSAICTSQAPFTTWECGRRIEQRLDGPKWITEDLGTPRQFVVARKHLPCTFKRTAIYELRGDLTDPKSHIDVCEIEELPSAGDTAYTALAPLGEHQYVVSWYSTPIPSSGDVPWLVGTYDPSDIWTAHLDFTKLSLECHAAPAQKTCPEPSVPSGSAVAQKGDYLLALAPVIDPAATLLFHASLDPQGSLSLQPLDPTTQMPTGDPWTSKAFTRSGDRFRATFDVVSVPSAAFPLLADPLLEIYGLELDGAMTGATAFCGSVLGYVEVYGTDPSDRIHLVGSTFGAVQFDGTASTTPVSACATP